MTISGLGRPLTPRTLILGVGIVGVVALLFIGRALTSSTRNLITDPSFHGSQLGWMGWNAVASQTAPGRTDGNAMRVVSTRRGERLGSFAAYTFPRPIVGVRPGETYRASAWVRATRGTPICLLLREWSRVPGRAWVTRKCVSGTGAWKPVPAVTTTTRSRGGELEVVVVKAARRLHDSFAVDDVTLVVEST